MESWSGTNTGNAKIVYIQFIRMKMITTVFVVLNDPCKSLMSNHLSSIATFMSIKVAIGH